MENLWGLCSPAPDRTLLQIRTVDHFTLYLTVYPWSARLHTLSCLPALRLCLARGLATLHLEMPRGYAHLRLPQGCLHLLFSAPAASPPGLRPSRPSKEYSQAPYTIVLLLFSLYHRLTFVLIYLSTAKCLKQCLHLVDVTHACWHASFQSGVCV